MNSKSKRRIGVVTGIIVIVLIALLAIVGGNSAAHTVTIAEALEVPAGTKIQVTGNVVPDSYEFEGNSITFDIYDPEIDPAAATTMEVRYDGGIAATFGNDVTAICTGRTDESGMLVCSELVTKCPSKYEDAEGALSIDALLGYGDSVLGKPVKVTGVVAADSLAGIDADVRFVIEDPESGTVLNILYEGAIPDSIEEGTQVVITGSLADGGVSFDATDVSLNG